MSRTLRSPIMLLAAFLGFGGCALASSVATIEVKGAEQTGDASTIAISFSDSSGNTYSRTISYGQFSTAASVAATIGASFANAYVPGGKLSAQVYCGTTSIIEFKLSGTATFGNLTVTGSTASFQLGSYGFASSGSRTTPTITWPTPAAITSGTALSGTQLNATANAAGVFTYFPGPGTVLEAGTQTLSATFTPTDITDYATATATVSLVVNADQSGQNTPVISWSTPAAISYGTPLSSAQLNASASYNGTSVLGTFEYTPAAGEILETGSQVLVVAFFPTDSVHYSPVGGSVSLQVNASSIQPLAVYSYSITTPGGASGYSSNSNLQNYTDSVTGTWSFNYDTLNRLVAGTPATGNNLCWSYDPFGNRTAQSSQSAACPTLPSVPTATASYNTNNQVTWTTVNAASSGFSYDAAGNVLSDNVNTYIYDGEGRVCAVKSEPVSGTFIMTEYIYDAEGNRVGKGTLASWPLNGLCPDVTAAGVFTPTNSYVLGPSNEQLTETDGNGNWIHSNVYAEGMLVATYDIAPTGDPALHFQLEDWLGSRRVQTDISGNPEQNFISLPFGDGLATIVPSGAPLTADDATEHHFTGKERDTESGNDYFGARYYGSSMGRFLSPDPMGPWVADVADPQSWNFYTYGRNNPLINVDPTGLDCVYFNDSGTGIDPHGIDRNSNSTECGTNGGDWINGHVTTASYFSDSDTWGFRSSDSQNNYLTYANAPGTEIGGYTCSGNCDIAGNGAYTETPKDNSWGAQPIAPSAQQLVQKVAQETKTVNTVGNCAGAGAIAFSPVTTPNDANDVSGALTDQGVDAAEKGLDALSDVRALSKGIRVGSKYLGKAAGVAGKGLAVHSAYENMKEAGCFGGEVHP